MPHGDEADAGTRVEAQDVAAFSGVTDEAQPLSGGLEGGEMAAGGEASDAEREGRRRRRRRGGRRDGNGNGEAAAVGDTDTDAREAEAREADAGYADRDSDHRPAAADHSASVAPPADLAGASGDDGRAADVEATPEPAPLRLPAPAPAADPEGADTASARSAAASPIAASAAAAAVPPAATPPVPHAEAPAVEPASRTELPPQAAPARVVAASFVLATDELSRLASGAGLEWVHSDADKIRAVQQAMADEPQPIRVPREPKPVLEIDEGPLVLVETRKDLSQIRLPFDAAPLQ